MTGTAKRMLAALVCAGLLLVSLPALAGAENQTVYRQGVVGGDDSVRAVAYLDRTVYVFTWGSVYYTWTAASGEAVAHPFDDSRFVRADGGDTGIAQIVSAPGGLYAIVVASDPVEGGGLEIGKATLCPVEFAPDGTATVGEGIALDWDGMVQEDGDQEFSGYIYDPFVSGGFLTFFTDPDGEGRPFLAFDTQTGQCARYTPSLKGGDPVVLGYCAYADGVGLIAAYDFAAQEDPVRFYALDLETGEVSEVGSIDGGETFRPMNLAYDAEAGMLYYTDGGQLFRASALDAAVIQAVAAAPVDDWSNVPPILTRDGGIILADTAGVLMRATDPAARAESSLTVYCQHNSAVEKAYYSFSAKYPDTEVVIAGDCPDITDAMLAQSPAVDIYVVDLAGEEFGALFARGYLEDLSGSAVLEAAVGEMYPDIQASVTKDGRLLALPVDLNAGNLINYFPAAFAKLGLGEADVPATWGEFFALLRRLPDLIGDTGITACAPYMTYGDFRREIFYALVQAYLLYLEKTPEVEVAFDTELFRDLVAEFEEIDFSGLGLPEDYGEASDTYDEDSVLFETYGAFSADEVIDAGRLPLALAMAEGREPMLEADLTVAFVNPYAANPARAIQYLEEVAANQSDLFLVNACPGRDDPVPAAGYENAVSYFEGRIDAIRAALEKADDADKAAWQAQLETWQADYDTYREKAGWDASAESIARYRAYARYLKAYTFFGIPDDDFIKLLEPVGQYLEGATDADAMRKALDQKLRMMRMEGM